MKELLIYPFDWSFQSILNCWEYMNDVTIGCPMILISPKGWGYANVTKCVGHEIEVSENFESSLEKCDTILLRETSFNINFEKSMLPKIKFAIEKGKEIIYCRKSAKELKILQQIVPHNQLIVGDYHNGHSKSILERQIYNINTPVVFICGISTDTYKFQTEMLLAAAFRKSGYKVSCIGCGNELEFLGEYTYPSFLYQDSPANEKILELNHFIKKIEIDETPDLILLIVPGEVMQISRKCVGDFGVLAFEFGKAITPDCIILNTTFGNLDSNFCTYLSKEIKKIFNKEIDFFNCVPLLLQIQESNDKNEAKFLQVDDKYIERQLQNKTVENVVHIFDLENAEKVRDMILKKLS